jgi:hypothetical protein
MKHELKMSAGSIWLRTERTYHSHLTPERNVCLIFKNDSEKKNFFNPLLFASCTDTFSKWCKITRGMKRSAQ